MPFDDTRAFGETTIEFPDQTPEAQPAAASTSVESDLNRRTGLERAVTLTAGILFGALGALAGLALVLLLLVALVIPATIVLALSLAAVLLAVSVFSLWMKRRAAKSQFKQHDELPGFPA